MTLPAELRLTADVHYDCVHCGRCCEDFDQIAIDPETLELLKQLDLALVVQDRKADGGFDSPIAFNPPDLERPVLRRRAARGPGGVKACCFLNEEKLCALHCAHGAEAKPKACRAFPFGFTQTTGGVYAGLSFACTAVLSNHGPSLAEQPAEAQATAELASRRTASTEIMLEPGLPLSWEQYLIIEADLADILQCVDEPIERRLTAQSVYLQLLSAFLTEARAKAGALWGAPPETHQQPLEHFSQAMKSPAGNASGQPWQRLLRIAAKPGGSPLLRRVFLGFALAFWNRGPRESSIRLVWKVFSAYLRTAFGGGTFATPRLTRFTPYRDLIRIKCDFSKPEHEELLRRYFGHCLFRKDLLIHDDVRFAHNIMLMSFALAHGYAASFAAATGRHEMEIEDLMESVRTVDQYFIYHFNLAGLLKQHPSLRRIMELIFRKPVYGFSMTRHGA